MKPILFNTEMVQAILNGRKTVTRQLIKPQPPYDDSLIYMGIEDNYYEKFAKFEHREKDGFCKWNLAYKKDDILYVRETWRKQITGKGEEIQYRADFTDEENENYGRRGGYIPASWRPSIHMPKKAARIFLKVTNVRVERLQDITDEQAIREGFKGISCDCGGLGYQCTDCYNSGWRESPKVDFMYMWNSTIKKSQLGIYGWDANPWVEVIEFERIELKEE